MKKSLRERATATALFLFLLALGPALFTYMTLAERGRRVHVLTEGRQIDAMVLRSDDKGYKRLCMVVYAFELNDTYYTGEVANCPLMRRYPTGSRVPVRLDLRDPNGSLPVGETVWPGYVAAPILLWPPWLLVAGILLFSLAREALSQRKKHTEAVRT